MAQACVMVQPNMESVTQPQCMATPARPHASANEDTSLITSTMRKRKDVRETDVPADKKARALLDSPVAELRLDVPCADAGPECLQSPGGAAGLAVQEVPASQPTGRVALFSPTFLGPVGARGEGECPPQPAPPSRPVTPPADNASTDASTGTSASLDQGDSGCTALPANAGQAQTLAEVRLAPAVQQAAVPTSPPPPSAALAPAPVEYEEEEDEFLDFDPYLFIKRLPPLSHCVPPRTTFLLPRQTRHSKQKTLVLDLDETLVHSTLDGDCVPDFTFPVDVGTVRHDVAVRKRPHLHLFLERVAQLFEVVVFTASQRVYAEQLLDVIDPGRRLIRHRIYRESCVLWEGNYLKDLTVLGRDLAHTLIVDNSPQAFGFQLENGVPIESWYDDDGDEELLRLLPFLEKLTHAEDVRPAIRQQFQLDRVVARAMDPSEAAARLQAQALQVLQQ